MCIWHIYMLSRIKFNVAEPESFGELLRVSHGVLKREFRVAAGDNACARHEVFS